MLARAHQALTFDRRRIREPLRRARTRGGVAKHAKEHVCLLRVIKRVGRRHLRAPASEYESTAMRSGGPGSIVHLVNQDHCNATSDARWVALRWRGIGAMSCGTRK
eukprot:SAG11_NODE_14018_length_628_cov_1.557656_1_plen_105_part_10